MIDEPDRSQAEVIWSRALTAMQEHLEAVEAALRAEAPFPGRYANPAPGVRLPASLVGRARHLHARQQQVTDALAQRLGALGDYLRRPSPQRVEASTSGRIVDIRS